MDDDDEEVINVIEVLEEADRDNSCIGGKGAIDKEGAQSTVNFACIISR